ncbi:MAG: ATP-binding protein [Candidatus Poribacteria bacterium]|nr:ATP-binding protein [Candidatus Poribacteria bacterium]
MRLKSRFVLAVNAAILAATTVFFFVDDYRLRSVYSEAIRQSAEAGIYVRGIAEQVHKSIANLVHGEELIERVQTDLRGDSKELMEQGVMEIRLADSLDRPRVFASMTGESELRSIELGQDDMLAVSQQERVQLNAALKKEDVGFVVNLHRHKGEWAIRIMIPYKWYSESPARGDSTARRSEIEKWGLIEILLSAEHMPITLLHDRLIHLLFVLLLGLSLTALINFTTDRIVLQPLALLTAMIQRAERGDPPLEETFPDNEIGRVRESLSKMLAARARLHAERISALELLSSGVAHEIRNPLHAISLSAQYLKSLIDRSDMSVEHAADAQETLDLALRQVRELNRITSQFMNLVRPSALQLERSDLRELMDAALEEFSLRLEEAGVQIRRRYEESAPTLEVDVARLRSVFYNLIQNAIQAMPGGGSLYVTVRAEEAMAEMEIRDTGRGITEDAMERIFEPYFTTREREGGVGLGLALAKEAVEAHGGSLTARSSPGAGAAFRIRLPVDVPPLTKELRS